jgi:hypothetical protein
VIMWPGLAPYRPDWATTPAYTLTYTVALLGMGALLLALTALYARESRRPGQAWPDRRCGAVHGVTSIGPGIGNSSAAA